MDSGHGFQVRLGICPLQLLSLFYISQLPYTWLFIYTPITSLNVSLRFLAALEVSLFPRIRGSFCPSYSDVTWCDW
jgi:hypothetical protein|uniref:Uncharacterized protein n=1 Tax=Populus trichocarpa TaxID=3694 RepID=A0A2K2BBC6_POPTR